MPYIDLGPYAIDPRAKARGVAAVTAGDATLFLASDSIRWAVQPNRESEPCFYGTLVEALEFVLGEPLTVGPTGTGTWLHTDGDLYLHDPATSGYKPADVIRVGDVIAYAGRPDALVLERDHVTTDFFGRQLNGFWCRDLSTGKEGAVPYGDGGRFPVKFKD
jgi:hypothetical protein